MTATTNTATLSEQAEARAPRQLTPLQTISQTLDGDAMGSKLAASLSGTGISPERFKRAALAALSRPEAKYLVDNCSVGSIYTALMNAAAAGLELHPALGQAYLIPRGGQAVLQVGYKGFIALADRAGIVVDADVIYAGDTYKVRKGTSASVEVEPELDPAKRGEWVAVYAISHHRTGAKTLTFMTRAEVEALRDKHSDAYKRGGKGAEVWKNHPEQMAIKTVVRRASKLWAISVPGGDDEGGDQAEDAPTMRDVTPAAPALPRTAAAALDALEGAL